MTDSDVEIIEENPKIGGNTVVNDGDFFGNSCEKLVVVNDKEYGDEMFVNNNDSVPERDFSHDRRKRKKPRKLFIDDPPDATTEEEQESETSILSNNTEFPTPVIKQEIIIKPMDPLIKEIMFKAKLAKKEAETAQKLKLKAAKQLAKENAKKSVRPRRTRQKKTPETDAQSSNIREKLKDFLSQKEEKPAIDKESTRSNKYKNKPVIVSDVSMDDVIGALMANQQASTSAISETKPVKEVFKAPRCVYCLRKMEDRLEYMLLPNVTAIREKWLKALAVGDNHVYNMLSKRVNGIYSYVLCNHHYDNQFIAMYKMGIKLPVPICQSTV